MFYPVSPPPLPVPIHSGEDCKKGSRDCFPENTQGGAVDDASPNPPSTDTFSVSVLVPDLGQLHAARTC